LYTNLLRHRREFSEIYVLTAQGLNISSQNLWFTQLRRYCRPPARVCVYLCGLRCAQVYEDCCRKCPPAHSRTCCMLGKHATHFLTYAKYQISDVRICECLWGCSGGCWGLTASSDQSLPLDFRANLIWLPLCAPRYFRFHFGGHQNSVREWVCGSIRASQNKVTFEKCIQTIQFQSHKKYSVCWNGPY